MIWIAAAAVYCVLYAAAVSLAGIDSVARPWIGDLGLLLSPLVPMAVVIKRRGIWNGRALVYWSALAIGCGLWVVGHLGWSAYELERHQPLPWVEWPVVLKLTGAVIPMLGLVAWPHAQIRGGSLAAAVLDIAGLTLVSAFLFWSFIVAPGLAPYASSVGVRSLAVIGLVLHVVIVACFVGAAFAAGRGPWRLAYQRLAFGSGIGSILLTTNASAMAAGTYTTGSFGDVGWIVPFWFFAWAASEAPASPKLDVSPLGNWLEASTMSPLLFVPVLVPIVGYGPRLIAPLGPAIDRFCDVVTAVTLTGALALTLVRVATERRARHRSDYRVWLLATACEQSSDLIVVARQDTIEYANTSFQRAFGYSVQELRLLPPTELVAKGPSSGMATLLGALKRSEVGNARLTLRRRDGSTFEGKCTITPIAAASGRSYFVGVVRDLTEELRLRDQMVTHERLSAIGEVVSGVAHEISNPLQSVMGLADLLRHGQLDAEARADLDRMRSEVDRAGRIIRSLRMFVRRAPFDRRPVDLNVTVRKAVAMRRAELERRRIQVVDECANDVPSVYATRDDLQQAVWQLIVNAEEAMTRGGGRKLTLRTASQRAGAVVTLEVIDEGPGIAPHLVGRIFEPFFSTKPVGDGQGLGLSVAFGIVAAHGGSLELVPTQRGACFRVTLPTTCA